MNRRTRTSSTILPVVTSMKHEKSTKKDEMAMSGGDGKASAIAAGELFRRFLVAAIITLLYELMIGHILEFMKIVMQTSPPGTTYIHILHSITAEKGITGLWDGFLPWGVLQAVSKGSVFGAAHHVAKTVLLRSEIPPNQLALTLAGGIAGGFQGYILSPILLLKTRVMTDPVFRDPMPVLQTTYLSLRIGSDVISNEGVFTLMKGANVFAIKRFFDWSTRYYFSDVFGYALLSLSNVDALSPRQLVVADLLGGFLSNFSTLPLDVLVAQTQDAKKAGVDVSAWNTFRTELKTKGWVGLKETYFKGFVARLLHVCFTTVVMKTGAGFMYDLPFK